MSNRPTTRPAELLSRLRSSSYFKQPNPTEHQDVSFTDALHIQLSYRQPSYTGGTYNHTTASVPTRALPTPSPANKCSAIEQALKGTEDDMGLAYNVYLNADRIFGCKSCKTHLATHDSIISRNFRGQHGKAYLFASVVNIQQADATERNMTTGRHVVRDISCRQCKETVGWKYDKAYESSEKYKEGKYILEAELLCAVY